MTAVSERNTDADVEEGDVTSKKALLSGPESRPSVTPLWAEREEEGEVEDVMEGIIDTDTHKEEAVTYENQGFEEEKEHASPGEGSQGSTGGHSAREHTGSAGDKASGSAPDPPHDVCMFIVLVGRHLHMVSALSLQLNVVVGCQNEGNLHNQQCTKMPLQCQIFMPHLEYTCMHCI